MAVPVRYVIYQNTFGVFLGYHQQQPRWSKKDADGIDHAPTYTQAELDRALQVMKAAEPLIGAFGGEPHGRICFPDLPDNKASKDAVANALLPRW